VSGSEALDTESLVDVIKENIRNLTDEIAYNLAQALQQTFTNMPMVAGRV
jgi:hypothetical protein